MSFVVVVVVVVVVVIVVVIVFVVDVVVFVLHRALNSCFIVRIFFCVRSKFAPACVSNLLEALVSHRSLT